MTQISNNEKVEDTRERILDEAEILFAGQGYHAVSVREITSAAQCNLAAVNYHFGNKHNLYLEVFRSRVIPRAERLYRAFEAFLEEEPETSTEAVVRSLARTFLQGPLSDAERERHYSLISRELAMVTEAFEMLAQRAFQPFLRRLYSLLFPQLDPERYKVEGKLQLLCLIAQVLYFNFARANVTRVTGCEYDERFKAQIVEAITRFSLHGLTSDPRDFDGNASALGREADPERTLTRSERLASMSTKE